MVYRKYLVHPKMWLLTHWMKIRCKSAGHHRSAYQIALNHIRSIVQFCIHLTMRRWQILQVKSVWLFHLNLIQLWFMVWSHLPCIRYRWHQTMNMDLVYLVFAFEHWHWIVVSVQKQPLLLYLNYPVSPFFLISSITRKCCLMRFIVVVDVDVAIVCVVFIRLEDIRGCCISSGMTHRNCVDRLCDPKKADFTQIPDLMVCAPWANISYACLANKIDHSPCCRSRGIPDNCLQFCSGNVTAINVASFRWISPLYLFSFACFARIIDVMRLLFSHQPNILQMPTIHVRLQ